eukprot:scaffold44817_cov46-Attheya_sp.AAC.2
MAAIKELDFDAFTPQLEAFLEKHRKEEKSKKDAKKEAEARKANAKRKEDGEDDDDKENTDEEREELSPSADTPTSGKKRKATGPPSKDEDVASQGDEDVASQGDEDEVDDVDDEEEDEAEASVDGDDEDRQSNVADDAAPMDEESGEDED